MEWSDLDAQRISAGMPEGVAPGTDVGSIITAVVTAINTTDKLVQVSQAGSEPFWVPANGQIYTVGGRVRLRRSPLDGGRLVYCEGAVDSGPLIVQGTIQGINTVGGTMTVFCLGQSVIIPYLPGTYAVNNLVHVLRSVQDFGAPAIVLGLQGNFPGANPGGAVPPGSNTGQLTKRQAVIRPTSTGSWRSAYSRWDSWNTDRYGGASTLYQGNAYGSGPMIGLATYGDQLANLNAVSIDKISVAVARADTAQTGGKVPVLQPSPNGTRPGGAPSAAGATSSGPALGVGGAASVVLVGSVLDGFRTGAYKGLCMVGGDYAGFFGTARGDGMVLTVDYTVLE